MRATRKIKRLFDQSDVGVGSEANKRIMSDVLSAFDESTEARTAEIQPGMWRLIMRSKITKLAAAAVVIVVAVLLITVVQNATTVPAYAIEQTVEAMKNVPFIHLVRLDESGDVEDERWIEIGVDGRQIRYRQDAPSAGFWVVEDGESTAVYREDKATVVIYDRRDKQYQWIGDLGMALENLLAEGEIIEENAEYEGRVVHRVLWPMMNAECYVDPETTLPIAIGRSELSYEEPPPETFEIIIPEGFSVIDKRPGAAPSEEPDWLKDDLTADNYFTEGRHALADGDYEKAAELLEFVVEKQSGRNWARFWLGSAYLRLSKYEAAIECYSQVIGMMDDLPYAYYARGLAYGYNGMEEAARSDLEKALPWMIRSLREIAAAALFEYADDPRLRDGGSQPTEEEVMVRMVNRLRTITGQDFGYDASATSEEKNQVIEAWERWFENGGRINFSPDAEILQIPDGEL